MEKETFATLTTNLPSSEEPDVPTPEAHELRKPPSLEEFSSSIKLLLKICDESSSKESEYSFNDRRRNIDGGINNFADTILWIDGKILAQIKSRHERDLQKVDRFSGDYLYPGGEEIPWSDKKQLTREEYIAYLKERISHVAISSLKKPGRVDYVELLSLDPETEKLVEQHALNVKTPDEEALMLGHGFGYNPHWMFEPSYGDSMQFPYLLIAEIKQNKDKILQEEGGTRQILEKFDLSLDDVIKALEVFAEGMAIYQPALMIMSKEQQLTRYRWLKTLIEKKKHDELPLYKKLMIALKRRKQLAESKKQLPEDRKALSE